MGHGNGCSTRPDSSRITKEYAYDLRPRSNLRVKSTIIVCPVSMVMIGIGVAGVVDGTEAPCAPSLVRTHRGKTIRLHGNRTTEVSQDDLTHFNSSLLTEFGWKRIVEERTGEKIKPSATPF